MLYIYPAFFCTYGSILDLDRITPSTVSWGNCPNVKRTKGYTPVKSTDGYSEFRSSKEIPAKRRYAYP